MFQTKFHASLEELVIEITEEEESRRSSKSSSSGRGGGRITRRRRKKNADGFSSVGNIKKYVEEEILEEGEKQFELTKKKKEKEVEEE